MEFKNFIIFAFGELHDMELYIEKIACKDVNLFSDGKGFAIYNLTSTANAHEIKDFISSKSRTIMVYELDDNKVAMDFQDINFAKMLFPDTYKKYVNNISVDEIMNEYKGRTEVSDSVVDVEELNIEDLSSFEAKQEIDKLLDKGYNNLNNKELENLKLLTKMV